MESEWQCSNKICDKRCTAVGNSHYKTFDGLQYDFMGQCSFILVKHNNFQIELENTYCTFEKVQLKFIQRNSKIENLGILGSTKQLSIFMCKIS